MTVVSHCDPTGTGLATGQLPVDGVPGLGSLQDPGYPRRGIVVLCHGLIEGIISEIGDPIDSTSVFSALDVYYGTLSADLQADGWVVFQPGYPEDSWSFGPPSNGLLNDLSNDAGHGARYLSSSDLLFDHIVDWRNSNYPGFPLYLIGFSEGGYHSLSWASNRESDIIAAIGHCPATIWSNVSPVFASAEYGTLDTSGMDLGPHALDATTIPILVSYATQDHAVAWSGVSTVGPGSDGVDVATFTGSGDLAVISNTNFVTDVSVKVPTTNGFATIVFTGTSGSTLLTGCRTQGGTGLLTAGNSVVQSNTDAMAAHGGANVQRHAAVGNNHSCQLSDVAAFMTFTTSYVDVLPVAQRIH